VCVCVYGGRWWISSYLYESGGDNGANTKTLFLNIYYLHVPLYNRITVEQTLKENILIQTWIFLKCTTNTYVTLCLSQNETPVKSHMYRSIFNNNFNLSFYSPKKDLCEVCVEYNYLKKSNSYDTQKTNFYEEYILRIPRG